MNASRSVATSRVIHFAPAQVYAAFEHGDTLAQWWGPSGFANEFDTFEFQPGGEWKFTMIAPNGARFANQSRFVELKPNEKLVIRHECAPFFTLTVRLELHEQGTLLSWEGEFDDPKVLQAMKHIVIPANEQNLDRLVAVLSGRNH